MGMSSKKSLHVILHTLGAIFARIYRELTQIFRDFAKVFTDFARIFTKSKLLGACLHPLHPASYTTAENQQ